MVKIRKIALKNEKVIQLFGHTLKLKYDICQDKSLVGTLTSIILVLDDVFKKFLFYHLVKKSCCFGKIILKEFKYANFKLVTNYLDLEIQKNYRNI